MTSYDVWLVLDETGADLMSNMATKAAILKILLLLFLVNGRSYKHGVFSKGSHVKLVLNKNGTDLIANMNTITTILKMLFLFHQKKKCGSLCGQVDKSTHRYRSLPSHPCLCGFESQPRLTWVCEKACQ
ncbi:hypothetical protein CHS0354_040244 [Potamilus streckersoni]|uniref:Uncharacterized protein n=1 Tax=Potamilus streckersoni TaxID=2493646 RepID=A0AAE0VP09_9BIVA|nr:hypothetical protein CHS0354_040244 [Potamilus streckersoni]